MKRLVIDTDLIKNYIEKNKVLNVVCDGVSVNNLVLDGEQIWYPCYKGHINSSDWIIDTEPTTEAEGSKHKECTVCGAVLETATIPKLEDTSTYLVTESGDNLTDEQGNKLMI